MRSIRPFLASTNARSAPTACCALAIAAAATAGACSSGSEGITPAKDAGGSDTGGMCQTPAGQDNGWVPSDAGGSGGGGDADVGGFPGEGGLGLGGDGGPPGDGGLPAADGGLGGLGQGGGGDAASPIDAGDDGGTNFDHDIPNPTGTARNLFLNVAQQIAAEPETGSVWVTPFGSNGRTCEDCHGGEIGWTLIPSDVVSRFTTGTGTIGTPFDNATATSNDQLDPIFRTNDGTVSPSADVSTPAARTAAYALLLSKGLIRVGLPVPDGAEFSLAAVDDPYKYASAAELSLFRRPLTTQNVRFMTDVMWDGRQTSPCAPLGADLASQANDAVVKHAQGSPLSDHIRQMYVDREHVIYFAQQHDNNAGELDADGAMGGPAKLASQTFYVGQNAYPGPDPQGTAYSQRAFTLFDAWSGLSGNDPQTLARLAIARGQAIFNTRAFTITNVKGLNDDLGRASISGTCTTCHNAPNLGNNSQGLRFDTGISDGSRRTADLPLYTLKNNATGETIATTDPGRALASGFWKDIGRFKVPMLRAVAGRAPYFHNGSAAALLDVVNVYNARFSIGLTDAEKSDLVAFLAGL